MSDFKEVTATIQVPANTGREGFLHTLGEILKKPRVQHIEIDARGQVKYRRYVLDGEDDGNKANNFGVDFDFLQPYHVVRNASLKEFMPPGDLSAAIVVGLMFDRVGKDQMTPLAFVTGQSDALWEWYRFTTGHEIEERSTFFGLRLLTDRHIPDEVLLLCAGYGKDAAFNDTQVSYKVEIPTYKTPTTDVQVLL